jgi:hypothetical protein
VAPVSAPLLPLLVVGAVRALVLQRSLDGGAFLGDADAIVSILLDGARRPR